MVDRCLHLLDLHVLVSDMIEIPSLKTSGGTTVVGVVEHPCFIRFIQAQIQRMMCSMLCSGDAPVQLSSSLDSRALARVRLQSD